MNTAQIQIRIDPLLKSGVQETLGELGLDISTAVKMFFKQIVVTKSLPIENRDINGFSLANAKILESSILEAQQSKEEKTFSSVDDLMADLKS